MTEIKRSVTHATFVIERDYEATRERVFGAFADKQAKLKWFVGPEEAGPEVFEVDFRVGGREKNSGMHEGQQHTFDAIYLDIVENERIIYAYNMFVGDTKLSSSLTTVEFMKNAAGTKLRFTEYGAYLDGHEDPKLREEGTRWLLGKLGKSLSG